MTSVFTNELHEALLKKSGCEFWKLWKSKFENKKAPVVAVNGICDPQSIANNFADFFASTCSPFSESRNDELQVLYANRRYNYRGPSVNLDELFDVELIGSLISGMKNGKAGGLDGLTSEHLKYCHPAIVVILYKLFNLFVLLGHVPAAFGASYIVPIPKCDGRSGVLSFDDFRGIAISPVISKIFEHAILDRFSKYFESSERQFGFKKQLSCRHVIFCVRSVVEKFISNGSTVNICSLDLSKAFDKINHFALFLKLMDRQLPTCLLRILETWFELTHSCVRWGNCFSHFFHIQTGVRQRGVLSPVLFSVYIDNVIYKAQAAGVGCYISAVCACIFLYADDIILISPSITGLQSLISACEAELSSLDMKINARKSVCIRVGPRFDASCAELQCADGSFLKWHSSCRYLGVYFKSGRFLRCSFEQARVKFFRAFNAILGRVGRLASKEVVLSLMKAKCFPVLFYGLDVCPVLSRDIHAFEFSINRVLMKLFRTSSIDIVNECRAFFGLLPVAKLVEEKVRRFRQTLLSTTNTVCVLCCRVVQLGLAAIN